MSLINILLITLCVLLWSQPVTNRVSQIKIDDQPNYPAHLTKIIDHISDIHHDYEGVEQIGNNTQGNLTSLCIRCSPGEYATPNCTNQALVKSKPGSSTNCTAGYCLLSLNCTRCPLGTASDQYNVTSCPPCKPGSYSDRAGALNCTECRPGSFESRDGSVKCQSCGQGYYNPDRASKSRAACRPCPAGSYCPDLESHAPVTCQPGWYCPATELPGPVPCPVGRYCPRNDMRDAESCPMGYYCPHEGLKEPLPCPMNHYCLMNTVAPESCSLLFASAAQQTECSPTVLFYVVIVIGGLFISLFLIWIIVRAVRRVQASAETRRRTEYTKLIPEPVDGPRYSGL